MSSVAMPGTQTARPATLQAAVALIIVTTLVGNVIVALEGAENPSIASVIIGAVSVVLHLVGAWGLWNLRRWGLVLSIILDMLDFLASIPFLFDADSPDWFVAADAGFMLLAVVILVLLVAPATRQAVRRA